MGFMLCPQVVKLVLLEIGVRLKFLYAHCCVQLGLSKPLLLNIVYLLPVYAKMQEFLYPHCFVQLGLSKPLLLNIVFLAILKC